jgi:predicted AlkP superfamily pyrophosphatase or phosphodiesterase
VTRTAAIALISSWLAMPLAAAPLLVISIDGLHPDYVIEADRHGLEIPTLRSMAREGAYARGVVGVVPTVTFPSHTTLVTGVSPAKHGIVANTPFDPLGTNRDGWYWYAEDIRVPTLWGAAAARGLSRSSGAPSTTRTSSCSVRRRGPKACSRDWSSGLGRTSTATRTP